MDSGRRVVHGVRQRTPERVREGHAQSTGARSEHDALMRVAAAAAGAHSLEEVLELAAEEARAAVGAASLSVSRWERDSNVMRTLINVGQLAPGEERFPEDETYPLDAYPQLERMLRHGTPYFNAVDDQASDRQAVALLLALGKESDVAVPIVVDGESWGEVWATTAPGQPRFRSGDMRFLGAIAGQLALVIGRAELFSRVSSLAYEDSLTGLGNRRAIEDRLERALPRRNGRQPLAVLVCDVDNLKEINDVRGHDAGDRALCRAAEALVAAAADVPGSLVGRLAGDEFCVVLEQGGLQAARKVGTAALDLLEAERDLDLTLSCGAAEAGPATRDPSQLLRAADTAQYAAKRRGGGQVCTARAGAEGLRLVSDRRSLRGSVKERLEQAVAAALQRLDGELRASPAVDRLEAVAALVAEAVNAAGWTVSYSGADSGVIRSVCSADDRDLRLRGLRVGIADEVYLLSDYPATAKLLAAGTGTIHVARDKAGSDPAECELLEELGFASLLAAVAADLNGAFMLELFGDGRTRGLETASATLRLLASAAVPPHVHSGAERGGRLAVVESLGERLRGLREPEQLTRAVVDELHDGFGWSDCTAGRLRSDRRIEIVAARGEGAERLSGGDWVQPADRGLIGRCLRQGSPVTSGDITREPDYQPTEEMGANRSALVVPVFVAGERWGVINVEDPRRGAFGELDVRALRCVSHLLGSALECAGRPADRT